VDLPLSTLGDYCLGRFRDDRTDEHRDARVGRRRAEPARRAAQPV